MYNTARHHIDEFEEFYFENINLNFTFFRLVDGRVLKQTSSFRFEMYEENEILKLNLSWKRFETSYYYFISDLDSRIVNPLYYRFERMKRDMEEIVIEQHKDFYKRVYEDNEVSL
jgi:hypothetical protein